MIPHVTRPFAANMGNVKTEEGERFPVDDNGLIFSFQSRLFTIGAEADAERFLRSVMLLDAHMQPYAWRWVDEPPVGYERLLEMPIETPVIDEKHQGYIARRARLEEKYGRMRILKHKVVMVDGREGKVPMTDEQIQYEYAVEWYRLIRMLLYKTGFLPRSSSPVTI